MGAGPKSRAKWRAEETEASPEAAGAADQGQKFQGQFFGRGGRHVSMWRRFRLDDWRAGFLCEERPVQAYLLPKVPG